MNWDPLLQTLQEGKVLRRGFKEISSNLWAVYQIPGNKRQQREYTKEHV